MSGSSIVSLTVILVIVSHWLIDLPRLPQPATVGASNRVATSGPRNKLESLVHFTTSTPTRSRSGGGIWRRDPLRDHRAVVGLDVRTPWYMRVRAVIGLILLILLLGLGLGGGVLLLIASGRFLLETLAG